MRYSAAVLDRVRHPRHGGSLSAGPGRIGIGREGSVASGTLMHMEVRLQGDMVAEARFRAFGCSAAIASASFVAEWVEGRPAAEALALDGGAVAAALELPADRARVAEMAVRAVTRAVRPRGRRVSDDDD